MFLSLYAYGVKWMEKRVKKKKEMKGNNMKINIDKIKMKIKNIRKIKRNKTKVHYLKF